MYIFVTKMTYKYTYICNLIRNLLKNKFNPKIINNYTFGELYNSLKFFANIFFFINHY